MFFQILNKISIILIFFLAAVCIIGDKLVESIANPVLIRGICDNTVHGLVGLLTAMIIVVDTKNYKLASDESVLLVLCCTLVASLIDIDHFIEARSLKFGVK